MDLRDAVKAEIQLSTSIPPPYDIGHLSTLTYIRNEFIVTGSLPSEIRMIFSESELIDIEKAVSRVSARGFSTGFFISPSMRTHKNAQWIMDGILGNLPWEMSSITLLNNTFGIAEFTLFNYADECRIPIQNDIDPEAMVFLLRVNEAVPYSDKIVALGRFKLSWLNLI